MNLQDLIQLTVELFEADPTAASVVLSWLEDRQRWYASAVRYTEKYAGGKFVVAKASGLSLEAALGSLAAELERLKAARSSPVLFEFKVIEEYCDAAPEDFGFYIGSLPAAGDVIQLKWLDGKDAYRVRVFRVHEEELVLRVRRLEDGQVHTGPEPVGPLA